MFYSNTAKNFKTVKYNIKANMRLFLLSTGLYHSSKSTTVNLAMAEPQTWTSKQGKSVPTKCPFHLKSTMTSTPAPPIIRTLHWNVKRMFCDPPPNAEGSMMALWKRACSNWYYLVPTGLVPPPTSPKKDIHGKKGK